MTIPSEIPMGSVTNVPETTPQQERDARVASAIAATLKHPTPDIIVRESLHPTNSWTAYHDRLIKSMQLHGIVDPYNALNAAVFEGLNPSIKCTTLLMESWGGKNIWGQDPGGNALPVQWHEQPVTPSNFAVYWHNVTVLGEQVNGCGPDQLTSKGLQEMANNRGGCWLPLPNMEVGAIFMKELINQSGSVLQAFIDYNGSGPEAEKYGRDAAALEAQLHAAFVACR